MNVGATLFRFGIADVCVGVTVNVGATLFRFGIADVCVGVR